MRLRSKLCALLVFVLIASFTALNSSSGAGAQDEVTGKEPLVGQGDEITPPGVRRSASRYFSTTRVGSFVAWADMVQTDLPKCRSIGAPVDDIVAVLDSQGASATYRMEFGNTDGGLRIWAVADRPGPVEAIVRIDGVERGRVSWVENDNCIHDIVLPTDGVGVGVHTVGIEFTNDFLGDQRPAYEDIDRNLFLAALRTEPAWVEQGPAPLTGSHNVSDNGQGRAVTGAIEAIAADPSDPDVVYVASVSGGVWKTENATEPDPARIRWQPLTDHLPSLSTSAIAISTFGAIYVGTGGFSAGCTPLGACPDGGPSIGVLKSPDGGDSWEVLGQEVFTGLRIRSIVPTGFQSANGEVVLAAAVGESTDTVTNSALGGVYRSVDGGYTWLKLSGNLATGLPTGDVSHLVGEPGNPLRYYAAVPALSADWVTEPNSNAAGVYRSDDGGLTWVKVINGFGSELAETQRIELTVCCVAGSVPTTKTVYAALLAAVKNDTTDLTVYRSGDSGDTWSKVRGKPRTTTNQLHFSFLADHSDPDILYVGDRVSGPFRVDTAAGTWEWLEGSAAGQTSIHPDSRT